MPSKNDSILIRTHTLISPTPTKMTNPKKSTTNAISKKKSQNKKRFTSNPNRNPITTKLTSNKAKRNGKIK